MKALQSLPIPTPHILEEEIRKRKIPLWQLRQALGGSPSECTLSRVLRGVQEMPVDLEAKLRAVVMGDSEGV